MTTIVHAVFENGVFRPIEPITLPESTSVEIEVRISEETEPQPAMSEGLARVYSILGERHNSGHTDTAARHNEHQPLVTR
jgi:predicted DNA-binding antitoxin AbrB/MazE fold protein